MVPHTYVNTRISYVSLVQDYYYAEIGLKDTLKPKMLCDADIVASAVFRNLVDSLRVSYRLHGGSGTVFFPKRSVDRDAFEILDMDCDLHHPSRNGFEIAPSELKEKLNAARNEFLGVGDDAASWFLFKHESVVQREGVETLVRIIEDQNPSFCFVEKPCRGCGATTLIRNVLYNLRKSYTCVRLFKFYKDKEEAKAGAVKNYLLQLKKVTGRRLLVFLNLDGVTLSEAFEYIKVRTWLDEQTCFIFESEKQSAHMYTTNTPHLFKFEIPYEFSERDLEKFNEIRSREPRIIGKLDLTNHFDAIGYLKYNEHLSQAYLRKELKDVDVDDLIRKGVYPEDILVIKGPNVKDHVYSSRTVCIHPLFLGVIFNKESRDKYKDRLVKTFDGKREMEDAVKLLVFFASFAPSRKIPFAFLNFFVQSRRGVEDCSLMDNDGSIINQWPLRLFVSKGAVLSTDQQGVYGAYIRIPIFAELLAERESVFNFHAKSDKCELSSTLKDFAEKLLGLTVKHFPQKQMILEHLGPLLVDVFCKFKIWHVRIDDKPKLADSDDIYCRYSFFIDFLMQLRFSEQNNGLEMIRELFESLVKTFSTYDYDRGSTEMYKSYPLLFATNAERFGSDKAGKIGNDVDNRSLSISERKNVYEKSLMQFKAARELLEYDWIPQDHALVKDRYGNSLKVEQNMIYKRIKCIAKPDSTGASVNVSELKSLIQRFIEVSMEAVRKFDDAIKGRSQWIHPMIGKHQTLTNLLRCVKTVLFEIGGVTGLKKCTSNIDCRKFLEGTSSITFLENTDIVRMFKQLNFCDIFCTCWNTLEEVRQLRKYARKDFIFMNDSKTSKIFGGERDYLGTFYESSLDLKALPIVYEQAMAHRLFMGLTSRKTDDVRSLVENHEDTVIKLLYCIISSSEELKKLEQTSLNGGTHDLVVLHMYFTATTMCSITNIDVIEAALHVLNIERLPILNCSTVMLRLRDIAAKTTTNFKLEVLLVIRYVRIVMLKGGTRLLDDYKRCLKELAKESEPYLQNHQLRFVLLQDRHVSQRLLEASDFAGVVPVDYLQFALKLDNCGYNFPDRERIYAEEGPRWLHRFKGEFTCNSGNSGNSVDCRVKWKPELRAGEDSVEGLELFCQVSYGRADAQPKLISGCKVYFSLGVNYEGVNAIGLSTER